MVAAMKGELRMGPGFGVANHPSHSPPAGLSSVVFGDRPLAELLRQVAVMAVSTVPGSDGAGLTVVEPDRPVVTVASGDVVAAMDAMQYELAEGPCIEAAAVGHSQMSGSLGGDGRWPRFGPRAGRLGVHSVLSLPLIAAEAPLGSLTVYGYRREAFGADAVAIAERFGATASVTVANAVVLEQSRRLTRRLAARLRSQAAIEQAIGVLMARNGAGPDEAFEALKAISQAERIKLVEVAETLVAQAVARVRARRAGL